MRTARSRRIGVGALAVLVFAACRLSAASLPDAAPTPSETTTVPGGFDPEHAGALCGDGTAVCDAADPASSWSFLWENLSVFGGLDGSKEPEDLGVNAHLGYRAAVNGGFPVLEQYGLGVQAGAALNYSNNAVRVLQSIDNTHHDLQTFTTVGLFQRSDMGVNWGLVYDFRFDDYYQHLHFGQ